MKDTPEQKKTLMNKKNRDNNNIFIVKLPNDLLKAMTTREVQVLGITRTLV